MISEIIKQFKGESYFKHEKRVRESIKALRKKSKGKGLLISENMDSFGRIETKIKY